MRLRLALTCAALCPMILAQSAATFEVATVKPSPDKPAGFLQGQDRALDALSPGAIQMAGHRVAIRSASLLHLISAAYVMRAYRVVGPSWMADVRYDIDATLPAGTSGRQVNYMLQTLLKERFGLRAHNETKQGPGFELVVAKGGPRLDSPVPLASDVDPAAAAHQIAQKAARHAFIRGTQHADFPAITMSDLADALTRMMPGNLPVLDRTNLSGTYHIVLDVAREIPGQEFSGPSIFQAVERYGLKLVAAKMPISVLVVDSVRKVPTEN